MKIFNKILWSLFYKPQLLHNIQLSLDATKTRDKWIKKLVEEKAEYQYETLKEINPIDFHLTYFPNMFREANEKDYILFLNKGLELDNIKLCDCQHMTFKQSSSGRSRWLVAISDFKISAKMCGSASTIILIPKGISFLKDANNANISILLPTLNI